MTPDIRSRKILEKQFRAAVGATTAEMKVVRQHLSAFKDIGLPFVTGPTGTNIHVFCAFPVSGGEMKPFELPDRKMASSRRPPVGG
jgi:hypothetical protein